MNQDELDPEENEVWAAVTHHLETHVAVKLPGDFAQRVQRELENARFWRELRLVLRVAVFTAVALTAIAGWALGLDWWQRVVRAASVANLHDLLNAQTERLEVITAFLPQLVEPLSSAWRRLPLGLLLFGTAALAAELLIFRLLRIGPFGPASSSPLPHQK